jgi:hypothetical protein
VDNFGDPVRRVSSSGLETGFLWAAVDDEGMRNTLVHTMCTASWTTGLTAVTHGFPKHYPQLGDSVGTMRWDGTDVAEGHMGRGWDLMRLVRSVTWLNRLRRSAMS